MDPKIARGVLALVAVVALIGSHFVDGIAGGWLLGIGATMAGAVGIKRPGDSAPLPKRDLEGDGY